jgi:hypothetical protein
MVNKLSQVHKWDAGGLQATTDPGNNMPAECAMTTHLTDTTWARVFPKKPGTFDCSPSYIAKVPSSLWGTKLNSDRISTQFLTPTVIKPQT